MKKIVFTIIIVLTPFIVETSCTDYLDVVPDNIPTIDHAFNKRYQAEGFLYGLYGFLPYHASVEANPAFYAGEETWSYKNFDRSWSYNTQMWEIAIGEQGTNPLSVITGQAIATGSP